MIFRPLFKILPRLSLLGLLCCTANAQTIGQQSVVHGLLWDIHEMTIGQVKHYAAATGFRSRAEQEGVGVIYEAGWSQKKGLVLASTVWRSSPGLRTRGAPDL